MDDSNRVSRLEARQLCKAFLGEDGKVKVEALRNVDLKILPGEFVSLVGASGSGKTTLLRLVHGLIPPTSGEVLVEGRHIDGPGLDRGFVFQRDALLPWRTVLDNVTLGLEARGTKGREARKIAEEYITLVGLEGFEDHYPHEISGGMRQRVNLARALVVDPDVLLMDEPFASVDAQTREIMQGELLRIWSKHKKTVLFVTHQIDEAVYLSDRVLVLTARPGQVKEVIEVDIPRPRPLAVKRTAGFMRIVDKIWSLIEEEVKQSVRARPEQSDSPAE